jgi:hypothetical protein
MATSAGAVRRLRYLGLQGDTEHAEPARRRDGAPPVSQPARNERAGSAGRSMTDREQWRVQLWLDDRLIEEHIAPTELAQQYADVIHLRIEGLSGRRLHCERISVYDLTYPPERPLDPCE